MLFQKPAKREDTHLDIFSSLGYIICTGRDTRPCAITFRTNTFTRYEMAMVQKCIIKQNCCFSAGITIICGTCVL